MLTGQATEWKAWTERYRPRRTADPDGWVDLVFSGKSVNGGVIRRAIAWVANEVGHDRFIAEVRRRGFHLVVTQSQYIIVCNTGPVRMLF